MPSSNLSQDDAALDGPDYLALIIEWDDDVDLDASNAELPRERPRRTATIRTIAVVLGALGALGAVMLATWGIRRLRA